MPHHPDLDDDAAEPLVIREPWFIFYGREHLDAEAAKVIANGGAWVTPFMGED